MSRATAFEFIVSDSMAMPLRGQLLRLRVSAGAPAVGAVAVGQRLIVRAPNGRERTIPILDHSMTSGAVSQARLDRVRELDIVVSADDAVLDGEPIGIGWTLRGPAE